MGSSVNAAEPYMPPFKETMVLFVHGINSDQYTWFSPDKNGKPREDGDTNKWWNYIHQSLGVSNYNMAQYSFSRHSGYHEVNMLELGHGGYVNEASEADAENNQGEISVPGGGKVKKTTGIADHQSWLDQAKSEYKQALFDDKDINPKNRSMRLWEKIDAVPDALLPSKLVVVGHSQGNYAIRGYIQSGALSREGYFDNAVEKGLVPEYLVSEMKGKARGFYEWPVEKAVFINPVLNGGSIHTVLILRTIELLNRLLEGESPEAQALRSQLVANIPEYGKWESVASVLWRGASATLAVWPEGLYHVTAKAPGAFC